MVVMPSHRRRFVADDGLHDVERDSCICRERYERVPQRVERCFWRFTPASLNPNGRDDIRGLEYP